MTGIEWLGAPQAALAALALVFLAISLNEYRKKRLPIKLSMEVKACEMVLNCSKVLSIFAPHILYRLEFRPKVKKWFFPFREPIIIFLVITESLSDKEAIKGSIKEQTDEFLSIEGNEEIYLKRVYKIRGAKKWMRSVRMSSLKSASLQ